ncbi:hypothetical protein V9T40_004671 [Parthenolecanium corni]|uniref:Uncharacterized protein n=1 Tax=Parthenolecanium corni TaxID=536013 RepID=A0AAN9TCE9_9HEMI
MLALMLALALVLALALALGLVTATAVSQSAGHRFTASHSFTAVVAVDSSSEMLAKQSSLSIAAAVLVALRLHPANAASANNGHGGPAQQLPPRRPRPADCPHLSLTSNAAPSCQLAEAACGLRWTRRIPRIACNQRRAG